MFKDYFIILKTLKDSDKPLTGAGLGKVMGIYNTTAQSRLEELEKFGLVEKIYRSKHMNLWSITYNGRAVLGLMDIIEA